MVLISKNQVNVMHRCALEEIRRNQEAVGFFQLFCIENEAYIHFFDYFSVFKNKSFI
jgi:hypothetical protein